MLNFFCRTYESYSEELENVVDYHDEPRPLDATATCYALCIINAMSTSLCGEGVQIGLGFIVDLYSSVLDNCMPSTQNNPESRPLL